MKMKVKTPLIPISWGELIDKITILEIKHDKIKSPTALVNITRELAYLSNIADIENIHNAIENSRLTLKDINLKLWSIEDAIREKESKNEFDAEFIKMARSIYKLNDSRATAKKTINQLLDSELVEEKSYAEFKIKDELK